MRRMQAFVVLYILHSYRVLEEVQIAYCAVDVEFIYNCTCSVSSLLWSLTKTHWITVCTVISVQSLEVSNYESTDLILLSFFFFLMLQYFCARNVQDIKLHSMVTIIYLFVCLLAYLYVALS